MDWHELEAEVREIASVNWNELCNPETIFGVRCDGVIKLKSDYWIILEITKESNLAKLRTDLAKFAIIRQSAFTENIYTECYFITEKETSSLKASGSSLKVSVLSIDEFSAKFIGRREYVSVRSQREFGSAVDPDTGKQDPTEYTPISYIDNKHGSLVSLDDIIKSINSGESIVLLGEFGTGKSRCVQEVFTKSSKKDSVYPILSINLRDHWGIKTFDLLIRAHLNNLGLSMHADNIIKLCAQGKVRILLDGFDEIGSQSWTGEADRLRLVRKKSLEGVKDLISKCAGAGIFICGREHYFSSNEEMFECLGLSNDTIIIKCPDEFSEEEAKNYIEKTTKLKNIPSWMPRKPLICQLISKFNQEELDSIVNNTSGEISFFENVLDAICARETRIHSSIDKNTLKLLFLQLASSTRLYSEDNEELSPESINRAFHDVSGLAPLDESAMMLQRLPYLGRVGSGNANRMFIDDYAKSGLKGLSLFDMIRQNDRKVSSKKWVKPLGDFGDRIIASKTTDWNFFKNFALYCYNHGNKQVISDYMMSRIQSTDTEIDMQNIYVEGSNIGVIIFSDIKLKNLKMENCYVKRILISNSKFCNCEFKGIAVESVDGIGSRERMPPCFDDDCEIEIFTETDTVSRISELTLTNPQKTLITIIKKLFFQPGRGRQAEALLRGTSGYWDKNAADQIMKYMLKNGIVIETKGDQGSLFIPQRRHTTRMGSIKEKMTLSDDELWQIVSD